MVVLAFIRIPTSCRAGLLRLVALGDMTVVSWYKQLHSPENETVHYYCLQTCIGVILLA